MGQPCSIEGCEKEQVVRTWCKSHYHRWSNYGDPEIYPHDSSWWALNKDSPCSSCNRPMRKASDPPDGRPIYRATGVCASCTKRIKEGGSPRKYTVFDETGQVCNTCTEYLGYAAFQPVTNGRKTPSGHHGTCNTCQQLKRYNLSKAQYMEMYDKQNGACAICLKPSEKLFGLFVDHDHDCCNHNRKSCGKCYRGLLCTQCNVMLGMSKDNTDTLNRAIKYLNTTKRKATSGQQNDR